MERKQMHSQLQEIHKYLDNRNNLDQTMFARCKYAKSSCYTYCRVRDKNEIQEPRGKYW